MIGTDSTFIGAKPSPRTYGTYPRVLGQFVRDEALLSLEMAVAKMTSMPAERLGIRDRGRIADGLMPTSSCSTRRPSGRPRPTTSRELSRRHRPRHRRRHARRRRRRAHGRDPGPRSATAARADHRPGAKGQAVPPDGSIAAVRIRRFAGALRRVDPLPCGAPPRLLGRP